MGVTWERFMDSNPKELEPYDRAHKAKIIEQDYLQHLWWGVYGRSAFGFAIDHCLNGKKAKSKYIEKPILQEKEEKNKNVESKEQIAVFEMNQRIKLLEKQGLPQSPI